MPDIFLFKAHKSRHEYSCYLIVQQYIQDYIIIIETLLVGIQ